MTMVPMPMVPVRCAGPLHPDTKAQPDPPAPHRPRRRDPPARESIKVEDVYSFIESTLARTAVRVAPMESGPAETPDGVEPLPREGDTQRLPPTAKSSRGSSFEAAVAWLRSRQHGSKR